MRVALPLLLVLLAGCTETLSERPAHWNWGIELVGHGATRLHSGAFSVVAFPDTNVSEPERCVAYRAELQYRGDDCEVLGADWEYFDLVAIGDPPWGVSASWQGRAQDTADDPDPDLPRTLVAFDAADRPVAWWAGTFHPEAEYATE